MMTLLVAAGLFASAGLAAQLDGVNFLHLSHVHRGGGKLERPDNTLSTFLWCWGNGSALECDCRKTSDGVGIMLHDTTLRRTAKYAGPEIADRKVSSELTWAQIRDFDVGSYLSPEFSYERIPTIDATFAAMKGHPTWLCFVDEKGAGPEMIARKAVEAGVQDQVYYTGSDYDKAVEWTRLLPGGKTLLWIGTWPRPEHVAADADRFEAHYEKIMRKVRAGGFKGVSSVSLHSYYRPGAEIEFVPRAEYLGKLVDEFHAHGIPVCSIPFEGGESEEVYFKLFDLGFDGFSTDYPSVMFSVIRKLREGGRQCAAETVFRRAIELGGSPCRVEAGTTRLIDSISSGNEDFGSLAFSVLVEEVDEPGEYAEISWSSSSRADKFHSRTRTPSLSLPL